MPSDHNWEPLMLATPAGHTIAARWYAPASAARRYVLLAPAMGVPQRFYEDFACWLNQHGIGVLTLDYQGIGESLTGRLKNVDTTAMSWVKNDLSTAVGWLHQHNRDELPMSWMGHSLGGQVIPLVQGHEQFERFVTVASGNGYWRENQHPAIWGALPLWYAIVPLSLALFGYFPGRRLGILGDVPAGVMWQWRRWCLNARYLVGAEPEHEPAYRQFSGSVDGFAFTDDEFLSRASIESLHRLYSAAQVRLRHIEPGSVGETRIGHLAAFKKRYAESLWAPFFLPAITGEPL